MVQQKPCCAHSGGNHPNGASKLCDGFSRIDSLPKKRCAGRIRLIRERIYTQTARTTLRWIFENRSASYEGVCRAHSTDEGTDIHPNGASQLCDGFSRTDQLPKKECAGRTRLMRERIYTQTARTTLRRIFEDRSASEEGACRGVVSQKECAGRIRLMRKRIYTQTARQETGGTGYLSAIRSFFPAPAIRSL